MQGGAERRRRRVHKKKSGTRKHRTVIRRGVKKVGLRAKSVSELRRMASRSGIPYSRNGRALRKASLVHALEGKHGHRSHRSHRRHRTVRRHHRR